MKRLPLLLAATLVMCFLRTPIAPAQDVYFQPALSAKDIELTLGADWYGVYLQNKKIGNCMIDRVRAGVNVVE